MALPPALQGTLDVLMIDNFDSFTWNLYQQLELLGASVTVVRNDALLPDHFPLLKINFLIISPGPGHPTTDSGISRDAIAYFTGKVPILGVCMGLECLVDLHGGEISFAGEIMHGKVSRVRHDGRGCYRGIPQGIEATRYHSLSAAVATLPAHLAVTSAAEDSGVIMGVRHRTCTLEAVQYHPESILSEGGDALLRNFLALRGGTWAENPEARVVDDALPPFPVDALPAPLAADAASTAQIPSILEKIAAQRRADVAQAEATAGTTAADLEALLALDLAPPPISFSARLQAAPAPALIAEIKRASPSSGPIALATSPAAQARAYAIGGAAAVSVLTEPHFFHGSLADMHHVRAALANFADRPAVLRKDFVLSRYQVLEARVWGADAVLLIVALLPPPLLHDLFAYTHALGMEALVEVHNAAETAAALALTPTPRVIGINNRNLHDFAVDMGTTSRLLDAARGTAVLAALSGIRGADDVARYAAEGVRAVLVGEALMRAADPAAAVRALLARPAPPPPAWRAGAPLVKICGVRTAADALGAVAAGADMLGLNFVPASPRCITLDAARTITRAVRAAAPAPDPAPPPRDAPGTPWFAAHAARLAARARPLVVGVFRDAPLADVVHAAAAVPLDAVQLHGREPAAWAAHVPVPVVRAFHGAQAGLARGGLHAAVLLDGAAGPGGGGGVAGGGGRVADWARARAVVDAGEGPGAPLPVILAGGLTPLNVAAAVEAVRPWAVDVSGGVETADGRAKDMDKVRAFVRNAKGAGVGAGV